MTITSRKFQLFFIIVKFTVSDHDEGGGEGDQTHSLAQSLKRTSLKMVGGCLNV